VGAINNGLEILQDETDAAMRESVLDLIEKSTRQTSNKLQFFRLAFGAAGGFSSRLDIRECEKATRAFLDGSRVELVWNAETTSGPKDFVKLLLNLTLVAAETMIRGGTMTITIREDSGSYSVDIRGEGQRVILQAGVKAALEGALAEKDLDPRAAPAFLANAVARDGGGSIRLVELDEGVIALKAKIDAGLEAGEE
jgi:histidine phosphotransferase ChpT